MKSTFLFLALLATITSQSQTYDIELYENRGFFKIYELGENILITNSSSNTIFSGLIAFRSSPEGSITIKPSGGYTVRIIPTIEDHPRNTLGTGTQIGIRPWRPEVPQPKITLFPNPANQIIQLKSSENIVGYKIYDYQGTLKSQNQLLKSKEFSVNLNNLIPGIYYATILLEKGQTISKQFIKQ